MDRRYIDALEELNRVRRLPGGIENPFLILRYGQTFFELGRFDDAKKELLNAYMLAGMKIFDDELKKYFEIIKPLI